MRWRRQVRRVRRHDRRDASRSLHRPKPPTPKMRHERYTSGGAPRTEGGGPTTGAQGARPPSTSGPSAPATSDGPLYLRGGETRAPDHCRRWTEEAILKTQQPSLGELVTENPAAARVLEPACCWHGCVTSPLVIACRRTRARATGRSTSDWLRSKQTRTCTSQREQCAVPGRVVIAGRLMCHRIGGWDATSIESVSAEPSAGLVMWPG